MQRIIILFISLVIGLLYSHLLANPASAAEKKLKGQFSWTWNNASDQQLTGKSALSLTDNDTGEDLVDDGTSTYSWTDDLVSDDPTICYHSEEHGSVSGVWSLLQFDRPHEIRLNEINTDWAQLIITPPLASMTTTTTSAGILGCQGVPHTFTNTTNSLPFFPASGYLPSGAPSNYSYSNFRMLARIVRDSSGNVVKYDFTESNPPGNVGYGIFAITGELFSDSKADLSVTGAATPDPAKSGDDLTYTFTIANTGPGTATDVTFKDTPPTIEGISIASSQGSCSAASPMTCNLGTLNSGDTVKVTIVGKPKRSAVGTTLVNTANVTSKEDDPDVSNNSLKIATYVNDCSVNQLSGAHWAQQFPTSTRRADLSPAFGANVGNFIDAMTRAGINVNVIATLRPPERAYLMHYSWRIANGYIAAGDVPDFMPGPGQSEVDICWVHRDAAGAEDAAASLTAAQQLVKALGIDPNLKVAPALNSKHTQGLAIDMAATWNKTITITDANRKAIIIQSYPRTSLNHELINVGASYGVIHFIRAGNDINHWSDDGH